MKDDSQITRAGCTADCDCHGDTFADDYSYINSNAHSGSDRQANRCDSGYAVRFIGLGAAIWHDFSCTPTRAAS